MTRLAVCAITAISAIAAFSTTVGVPRISFTAMRVAVFDETAHIWCAVRVEDADHDDVKGNPAASGDKHDITVDVIVAVDNTLNCQED